MDFIHHLELAIAMIYKGLRARVGLPSSLDKWSNQMYQIE